MGGDGPGAERKLASVDGHISDVLHFFMHRVFGLRQYKFRRIGEAVTVSNRQKLLMQRREFRLEVLLILRLLSSRLSFSQQRSVELQLRLPPRTYLPRIMAQVALKEPADDFSDRMLLTLVD